MKNNAQKQKEEIHINGKMALAALLTFILLIGSLVPVFVGVAMDIIDARDVDVVEDDGNKDKSDKDKPDKPAVVVTKKGEKTGIELPSQTVAGTYLCNDSPSFSEISGINSGAAVLVDITGSVTVAGKNADARIYPASMTKIMTLLVACENAADPNALLTVSPAMITKYSSGENQGASVGFAWAEGDQVTVEDALHLVIYKSDTFACWLLAEHIAGSEQGFVDMMNQKASALGLTQTKFANCTGIHSTEHYTTCREMAAIMAAVMNNSAATQVITRKELYNVDKYKNGEKVYSEGFWSDWYSGRLEPYRYGGAAAQYAGGGSDIMIIGGKTGWETIPTSCFVTSAMNDITGRKYVCVQVGRIDSASDSINGEKSTLDTRLIYREYATDPT